MGKPSGACGRVWVCKDGKYKRLLKEDVDEYINKGWSVGGPKKTRTDESRMRYKEASSGRVHIHYDDVNTSVKVDALNKYLEQGWKIGWVKRKSSTTNQ